MGANDGVHATTGRPSSDGVATEAETPREERTRAIVTRTAVASAALGAVLSPIPMADEIALVPIYAFMASRIGRVHGLSFTKIPWRPLAKTALSGLGVRAGLNVAFAFVPGVAAFANATSAAALTVVLGRWVEEACRVPEEAEAIAPAAILEALKRKLATR